jgi:ABC-2 type transport system permease protein
MTAVASAFANAPATRTSTVRAGRGLMLRGLRAITRLPSAFFPAMLMPIFQSVAFSGTFFAITKVPGFPTDRSINWFMPLGVLMGSAFSGVGLGFSLIRDLETGFFDRLRMSPAPRHALTLGPLFTAWFRTLIVVTAVMTTGFILGARLSGGVLGVLMLYIAGLGIATIATGWGLGLAYIFKDMRGAAIMQLGLFTSMFLSTAQAPLSVMTGWLHGVATINPVTNILRLARQGFLNHTANGQRIGGVVTWHNTWGGLLAILVLSSIMLVFARRGLDKLDK